ncbi:hypothetical protein Lupro_02535 [Lutibacter profundi]|uniref:Uncharacterized protein n=1 Tax=Lutibacter profundi TaxID=1622118 RepID=A0A120IE10_9FLAO|nr:TIGR04423 family type III CRISPR-associated protein [Lutibacter profundi]AMC10196.1 hypothetical protein Lupro_02535 [Lutibacter profundi]
MKLSKEDFIKDYNNKLFIGYIWMVSSKEGPKTYLNKAKIDFETLYDKKEPHNKIQEAYLYDGTNSIHIKNIDGEELFYIHNIEKFSDKTKYKNKDLEFPSHIITGKNLKFKQVYQLKESLSGTEFKTWQPIVHLFKGFEPKNNTQNQPKTD